MNKHALEMLHSMLCRGSHGILRNLTQSKGLLAPSLEHGRSLARFSYAFKFCRSNANNSDERSCSHVLDSKKTTPPALPQRARYLTQSTLAHYIVQRMPQVEAYLNLVRFDKPIGTWLLFLPCAWSISLAAESGHIPDLKIIGLFGIGSILLRSAGCIINDMWDSDFDKKVERTKSRPLASNQVTHNQAFVFLGGILTCGLMVLLSLNWYSIILGASSMIFVVTYPLMKRFTNWPQLFLGITFNWGAVIGWSAVKGYCDWSIVIPLYLACISWTLAYDTIYAHQDKADDILIGVKSTALLFQDRTVPWLGLFSTFMATNLLATGIMADQTWPYFAAVAGVSAHLLWQITTVDLDNAKDCASKFKSNKWLGLMLLAGIIVGNLNKKEKKSNEILTDTKY